MGISVDTQELMSFARNLSKVPDSLESEIKVAFNETADEIIQLAILFKPSLQYASGYRSGELNRSYEKQSRGRGSSFETEIRNEAQHFNSVEAGSTSSNVLYGYFQQGWRTGSGKAMFVTGEGTNDELFKMSPWKGYFMLKKATYDPTIGQAHEARVAEAVQASFSKALGG